MLNITEINVDKTITDLIIKYKNRNRHADSHISKIEQLMEQESEDHDKELQIDG